VPLLFLRRPSGRTVRSVGALSAVGLSLVVAIVMGAAIGYGLDAWLGTKPWLFLLGFVMGVAAGVVSVFRVVDAVSRSER
jgi:ATP synthase protein I